MTTTAHRFDSLTAEHMCAGGSWKWSTPGRWRGEPLIGAFVAEMDYPVAAPIADAVRASTDASLFGYLPDPWVADMAAACAGFWREHFGWAPEPEWIRPVPDVLTAFTATVTNLTPPGTPVVLPTPAYMPFLYVPGMIGRELITVPMARDGARHVLDLDGLDRALSGGGLLLLTNPHNPTGRVFDDDELAAVTAVVDRHGARVFSDEIHAPLTFGGARHRPYAATSPTAAAHTVTATSASKAWNVPGLKCGQILFSHAPDVDRWRATGYLAEHGTATPGVPASTAAYREGGPWLDEVLAYLEGNRELLAQADVPGVEVVVPEGTYLAWLDARGLDLGEAPAEFFRREAGVVLTDGAACGEPGAVRMTLATGRPVLTTALERMRAALS